MNSWLVNNLISAWLIVPGSVLMLAAIGGLRARRHPHSGKALVVLALTLLGLLSMPWVSRSLLQILELPLEDPLRAVPAQAIVVLGGGQYQVAPEYGTATVGAASLVRLRYGAHLHRQTGKPLLLSGGAPGGSALSEAQVMKAVLENEFKVAVQWMESNSNNTLENARASRAMLAPLGINRIYLVTHAWHMRRAQAVFLRAGFDVVPAPTQFATQFRLTPLDFMPSAGALHDSSRFLHEILGLLWYRLKSSRN